MYRFLLILLSVVGMAIATGAQQRQDMSKGKSNNKILVAYFSATGTTARAAEKLADVTNGELYAIVPARSYTSADLDWNDKRSRSSVEMNDPSSRPELTDYHANIAGYDRIFLGFPIWWYTAPTVVRSFLESYDFTGKTIILFATSGGSGLGKTAKELASSCPGAAIEDGRLLNGNPAEAALKQWAESF